MKVKWFKVHSKTD